MKTAKACAKIILFGEHAVVYDKPGIAVPIKKLYTLATASSDSFSYTTDREMNEEDHMKISKLFKLLFEKLNVSSRNISVDIESNIPLSSGLGSSASLSIALIRAFSNYFDLKLDEKKINDTAFECEKIFHGMPSGIDNTVITYEKPIFFKKNNFDTIILKKPINLIIANTGIKSNTKEIVLELKERYEKNKEAYMKQFDNIEKITLLAKESLEKGDIKKLGRLMTQNHEFLGEIGISNLQLDAMVNKALKAGAYGAKLAGAGRGGNIIALVDEKKTNHIMNELRSMSREIISSVII